MLHQSVRIVLLDPATGEVVGSRAVVIVMVDDLAQVHEHHARVVALGFPCVHDAVVTGLGRDEVGLLIVPRLGEVRRLAELPDSLPAAQVLAHSIVRGFFQDLADQLWAQGTGSANRPARLLLLAEPPSIDGGEITDKGSINQRAVLSRRAALVELLHEAADGHPDVITPHR